MVAKIPPIPLPSNAFDIALATEFLEHITNPQVFLREMVRIIKPKGFLIITTPDNALAPYAEREHVDTYNTQKIEILFNKIREIEKIKVINVGEENKKFYHLVVKAKKCLISV